MAGHKILVLMAAFLMLIGVAFASNSDTLGVTVTILGSNASSNLSVASATILNTTNGTVFHIGSTLVGFATVQTNDSGAEINVTYKWYNGNVLNSSGNLTNVSHNVSLEVNRTAPGMLKGQNWTLEIDATDGIGTDSLNSSTIMISNTAPTVPVQTLGNGTTSTSSSINLTWAAASDADSDSLNYSVCYGTVSPNTCVGVAGLSKNISLSANQTYYWKVRAYDGTDYSAYSPIRVIYTYGAPYSTTFSLVPDPFTYGDNIGCSFTVTLPGQTSALVSYWLERGDGYIPTSGQKSTVVTTGVLYSDGAVISSSEFSPNEAWRCGITIQGIYNTTEYTDFQRIVQTTTSTTGGSYSGYSPPGANITLTQNQTLAAAATKQEKVGAFGFMLSSADIQEPVAGNLLMGHVILLTLLMIFVFSFNFKEGLLRWAKYAVFVVLVISTLIILPVAGAVKV